jgi:hypothetical protein
MRSKSPVNILLHLPSRTSCKIIGHNVCVQFKLGPDDKVDYPFVNAVGPVVAEDFDVIRRAERMACGRKTGPSQELVLDIFGD